MGSHATLMRDTAVVLLSVRVCVCVRDVCVCACVRACVRVY